MKRYFVAPAALFVLLLVLSATPAFAGGGLPGLLGAGGQDQSVRNSTDQSNEAGALNVPILSGNNVALINTGDQQASAGTKQEQTNVNVTKQSADQSGGGSTEAWKGDPQGGSDQSVRNSTGQENEAGAVNVPIASGNNVASDQHWRPARVGRHDAGPDERQRDRSEG